MSELKIKQHNVIPMQDNSPKSITDWRLKNLEDTQQKNFEKISTEFDNLYTFIDKKTRPNYQLYGMIISAFLIIAVPLCTWLYNSIVSEEEFKEYQIQNMKEINEIKVLILSEDMRKNEIKRIKDPKEK